MTFSRALALPAALVVVLTVVGAWIDGSSSSSAGAPGNDPPAAASSSLPVGPDATADPPASSGAGPASTAVPAPPTSAGAAATPPVTGATRTSCPSVVHIGDSTSVGLMDADFIDDPARRVDAQYARVGVGDVRTEIRGARSIVERYRGEENATEVATRQKAAGFEGCWVLALGTTDAANMHAGGALTAAERIDRLMAIVGDDPVLWVNTKTLAPSDPHWADSEMVAWNQALLDARARHPNLQVYDWAAVVQDAWFQGDGIHYTSAGNVERARLIADALAAAYPAS
jgi:hypothetical protein